MTIQFSFDTLAAFIILCKPNFNNFKMPPNNMLTNPLPPGILNALLRSIPVIVSIFGSTMEVMDYLDSGAFVRNTPNYPDNGMFDFIVVGGGTAGAAVAGRLSENPYVRVLLIEAGGDPNPVSYIPSSVSYMFNNPSVDWMYKTVRLNGSALGIKNQEIMWPRGKSLGGTSNINFMVYMRGNPNDFDRWADHSGDSSWNYKNLKRYFRRIEDYLGTWDGNEFHGRGGPMRIERAKYHPGLDSVMEAAHEMGYQMKDPNGNQTNGFSPLDFTMKGGRRFSTYQAYILPSMHRRNLVIYRYAMVTKIHFNETSKRAVGVSYLRHGMQGYARASREIILCGGAINSPQLLMLSGIGPKEHLDDLEIKTMVNLPGVGNNLQDHVATAIGPFMLNKTSESFMLDRDITIKSLVDFMTKGEGPLTSPQSLIASGLVSTRSLDSDWPNIFFYISSVGVSSPTLQLVDSTLNANNLVEAYAAPDMGKDSHFVIASLGLPKSRGYIRLRDKNPFSKPIINPQYFSDKEDWDIKEMIKAVEMSVMMYENTTVMRKMEAHLPERQLPGCEHYEMKSLEYYECHVRTATLTLYHPTSTCSMGKRKDPNAVVDSQLRVIGTKGLRVADASIMPFITNANTNAPTIVIGEMCADMIKKSWKI